MKKVGRKTVLWNTLIIAVIFLLAVGVGTLLLELYSQVRKKEAENVLQMYEDNITLIMREQLNYAHGLNLKSEILAQPEWVDWKAQELMAMDGVVSVIVFNGDKVQTALPESIYQDVEGRDLRDFSYLYTLAKVVKEAVAEGPVVLDAADQSVFLFLQPILDGGEYKGEIAVALDAEFVMQELNLERLYNLGYEYHLWKVNSQDGSKDVVESSNAGLDFSYAAKIEFYLPSQWTLSIMPQNGWIPAERRFMILGTVVFLAVILSALFLSISALVREIRYSRSLSWLEIQTGMYNKKGFRKELERWIQSGTKKFTVFYFVIEDYSRAAMLAGEVREEEYLRSIPSVLDEYVKSPYICGRIAQGGFVAAVKEELSELDKTDFARGLVLKMMWKLRIHGEKVFLSPRYEAVSYPDDGSSAGQIMGRLTDSYYRRLSEESPVSDLTEKCRQLIAGRTDVEFTEYTNFQLMELSKTLNQYRKQVEQMIYEDSVYNIGNRMKYLRDVNILISYDAKRRFRLYGVDIRSFSKYNELFGVQTGDALLMEVSKRLKGIFGGSLYRINGDVFMGISFEEMYKNYKEDQVVSSIWAALKAPMIVKDTVFTLDAFIGICDYPINAKTAESLLECVQTAVNVAKNTETGAVDGVKVYNEELLRISRREDNILRLLKNSLHDGTLEVWYQPVYHIAGKKFTGTEALVRLPDGEGGYVPASQMAEIAERNGIVSQVGEYVLYRASKFMKEHGAGLGLEFMGINVSVQQLFVENSAGRLLEQIRKAGVQPAAITLEITETVLIQSMEKAEGILNDLRNHGISIALDDFGSGCSSLNYLMKLPVDALKIDRSLIQSITGSDKQYKLLKTIIKMADINQIEVVVEGVETEEEQGLIAMTNADYIQGYYYSRPLPEDKLREFLQRSAAEE